MKDGRIHVYSGRGMVIGCAEAGKTTLVKKLKREKHLETQPTKGIEIHTHVFKLDKKESTIIGIFVLNPTELKVSYRFFFRMEHIDL